MPGILDQIDPQTQGLLQAAFAGLSASGPSRMPVSMGQVIGQAGQAGMGAFNQQQQAQQQMVLRDLQIKKAKQEHDLQQQLMGAAGEGGILGKGMNDPDTMEALGTRLALSGHPGGAALINAAGKVRERRAAAQQLGVLKSSTGAPVEDAAGNVAATDGAKPGIFGTLFGSQHVGPQAKALQATVDASPAGSDPEALLKHYDRLQAAHLSGQAQAAARADRQEGRDQSDQTRRDLAAQAAADRRSLAEFARASRPAQIVNTDQGIFQVKDGVTTPVNAPGGGILRPAASGRIDASTTNQLQRQFNSDTKPNIDALGSTLVYRDARATGDTAQAAMMAAEALRRSARGGSARFKGEAEKLLGSGYGAGSIVERMENFLAQEFKGTPSANTMQKLDALIGATEQANLENIAQKVKKYGGQARQRGLPVKEVIGEPLVQGNFVVFPDGDMAKFKSPAEANGAAKKWLEAN